MNETIRVSVICLTYNHEKYIRNALEGFIAQKTDFHYEVLINDDASTDGTAEIIREYELKYPDIIKPLYQKVNQYSQGIKIIPTFLLPAARGDYLAWCEGDDYWTDPYKLQKQVNFLDANPDYSACSHMTKFFDVKNNIYTNVPNISSDVDYTADEQFYRGVLIQLCSFMIRKDLYINRPNCFDAKGFGDWQLFIYSSICGKFHVFSDVMSLHMHSVEGSWTSRISDDNKKEIEHCTEMIRMLKEVDSYYGYKYTQAISHAIDRAQYTIYYRSGQKKLANDKKYKQFKVARQIVELKGFIKKYMPFLVKFKPKRK